MCVTHLTEFQSAQIFFSYHILFFLCVCGLLVGLFFHRTPFLVSFHFFHAFTPSKKEVLNTNEHHRRYTNEQANAGSPLCHKALTYKVGLYSNADNPSCVSLILHRSLTPCNLHKEISHRRREVIPTPQA